MSGIFDQIINYSPPLIVSGTVNYKGTWNASTNNPPLSNPPVASTKGDYYVVSTAGTQFSISFAVGDWIISSGTAWEKVDLTDAVSSVFGRTGAVVGVSTDYSAVGLTNTAIGASSPSTGAFTTVTASSTIAATGAVTGSNLSGTNTGDQTTISGNAGSATILQTARNINGVSFNGSADITVAAAAGTLTGATLASGVTASSLTSVGTIASLTATALTVNDNTTLGSSNTDTVTFNARVASDINPSADDTYDLGVTGHEWRNLNIDGTANIDSLVADTADINGGTIDGTTVGATTPSTGAFTTLSATGEITANTNILLKSGNDLRLYNTVNDAFSQLYNPGGSGAHQLAVRLNGTNIGTFTSTGLAVTGALSATGKLSSNLSSSAQLGIKGGSAGLTVAQFIAFDTITTTMAVFERSDGAVSSSIIYDGSGLIRFGTTTAHNLELMRGGTTIAALSTTGLAVTGALSATGNGTFGGGGVSGTLLASNAGVDTTAYTAGSYNANHRLWLGTGNATNAYAAIRFSGSGGVHEGLFGTVQNASGNAEFFWNLYSGSSYAERLRLSATGLAVTGALSCTGALAIGNTVNTVSPTSPNRTVTIVIGGTTYYLAAKTTND